MSIAGLIAALVLMFAAGFGVTAGLWRGRTAILLPELFGLSCIFGAGFVSLALAVAGTATSGLLLQALVAFACLAFCAYGIRRMQSGAFVIGRFDTSRPWERWLVLLMLLPIATVAFESNRVAIAWDGLFIWEFKARIAYQNGGAYPASIFSDAARLRFHPSYPLFLPLTETWIYLWMGSSDQTLLKVLFPILFAATVALLWSSVMRLTQQSWIASLTATLPLAVPMMMNRGFGLVQGYSDLLLGTVYLVGFSALLTWRIRRVEALWYVAAAAGAMLPWIKQEGMILFASLAVQAALTHGWRGWRGLGGFILPGIITIVAWKAALWTVAVVEQTVFQPLNFANFLENAPRAEIILRAMFAQLTSLSQWSMLWLLVPLALLCIGRHSGRLAIHLTAALLIPLAGYSIPYLFTTLDINFHIRTSLDRLILQLSLVTLLSLGLALAARTLRPPEHPMDK